MNNRINLRKKMAIKFTIENLKQCLEDGCSTFKNWFELFLLPIAIPLMFLQEVYNVLREKTGLGQRTLEGKVVLVTGASSGIGESLAKYFYLAGCRLILVSRRKTELERVKNQLVRLKTDGKVHVPAVLEIDIGDLEKIPHNSQQALSIYGQVDILINNAGISIRGTVLETEFKVQEQIMNVNYFGPLALTKCLLPQMIDRGSGNIVFMSSVQGKLSIPDRSGYTASKHAVQAFADCLRAEINDSGVQVTVICPGYVKTNLSINSLSSTGEAYGKMDANTAKGYSPDYIGKRTFRAILNGEKEVIIAPIVHRIAIFVRTMLPNLYFYLMTRRVTKKSK